MLHKTPAFERYYCPIPFPKGAALFIFDLVGLSPDETATIRAYLGHPLNYRVKHLQPGITFNSHHIFNRRPLYIAMRWESRSFDTDFFRINEFRGQREWTLIVIFEQRWTGFFSVRPQANTQLYVNSLEITWPAEDALMRIEKSLQRADIPLITLHVGTTTLIQRINPAI